MHKRASMSTTKFRFILRDLGMMRLWSAWTHKYIFNSVVRRCIRDRGVREVIQRFRHTILRPKRTLLLSATAAYKSHDGSFSCDQGISDGELQDLLSEMENAQNLVKRTMYCTSCGKRLVIDRKQADVIYCGCKEPTSQNDPDGWVPYMETDDVIIWRKEYKPGKGLYAYKVYGRYPELAASDFAAVQIDGAYRRAWDSAVAALAVVQRDARGVPGQAVLHWEVLWPRLFANRDYVYIRRHKEFDITTKNKTKTPETPSQSIETSVHAKAKKKSMESYAKEKDGDIKNKVYIIVSKSCEHPDVPETKHAIRVAEYWSHMVVKSSEGTEKAGMEFVLTYYDEPGVGGMPGGVAAWASSRAAPAYLQRMRRAAADYRAWAKRRPSQELPDFVPFGPDQVNNELEVQIKEQDMESSKLGPEMENGGNVTTRDQGSQTEEFLIKNYCMSHEIVKNESRDNKEGRDVEVQMKGEVRIRTNGKDTSRSDKDASSVQEGDSEKAPEEENNGGWWRYLYPFYYFV